MSLLSPELSASSRLSRLALVCVVMLISAGLLVVVVGERNERVQLAREAGAQADLLAQAVRGALAFDDAATARDYVDAVQVNGDVLAAAVFDSKNRLVAGFARPGEVLPMNNQPGARATVFRDGRLRVARPVSQAGQALGSVRIILTERPLAQRLTRYAGFSLILGLAALVVLVLGVAQGALRRANVQLAERARDLALANSALQAEIQERARAEEALRQSQKMEAIGRLTGGIAHDFNNLLMATSSGVDLLERTSDPDRRRQLSEGVRQAIDRGAALTRRLLAFSRTAPLQTQVVDLGAQVESMRILLERSLREDIEVRLELEPDLWPVEVDLGEFELALINLAVNARDAMPNGGWLTVRAENRACPDGVEAADCVALIVSDTGEGIDPNLLTRVFEPFFTTKEVGRGTGLGLSQVYGFARSSGGQVSIVSELGQGATVSLILPRSQKPLTLAARAPDGRPAQTDGRVLLVEDDDAVAEGVGHMLRDLGYSYVRAYGGAEALRHLERGEAFDLVLTDMVMPGGVDGLTLAREVRRKRPGLPVLLTTGYSETAATARGEDFQLLSKPYRLNALSEAIQRVRG